MQVQANIFKINLLFRQYTPNGVLGFWGAVVHDPCPDQHGSWRIKSVRLMNPNNPADVVDITKCLSQDDWHEVDRQLDLWADLPTTGDLDV